MMNYLKTLKGKIKLKILKGKINEIILNDEETILISMLKGNKRKISITSKEGSLQIDDIPIKKIDQTKEETAAISNLQKIIQKRSLK